MEIMLEQNDTVQKMYTNLLDYFCNTFISKINTNSNITVNPEKSCPLEESREDIHRLMTARIIFHDYTNAKEIVDSLLNDLVQALNDSKLINASITIMKPNIHMSYDTGEYTIFAWVDILK